MRHDHPHDLQGNQERQVGNAQRGYYTGSGLSGDISDDQPCAVDGVGLVQFVEL
jgi:hypothetical protein